MAATAEGAATEVSLFRERLRWDLRRARAFALLWGGWLLVTGLTFSYMQGIIHPYYMVALAPAIGALVGVGAMSLWQPGLGWLGRAAGFMSHTSSWLGAP